MGGIKYIVGFAVIFLLSISRVMATCVLNSDFGFTLDCAFKKSGLFRVRNLGGIKAHVGLGFTIGDELGFPQSLTNLDTSKRRSVSAANGAPLAGNSLGALNRAQQQQKINVQPMKNRLTVRIPSTSAAPPTTTFTTPIVVPVEENYVQSGRSQAMRQMSLTKPTQLTIPPFKPIAPAQDMVAPFPTAPTKQVYPQYSSPTQNTIKSVSGTQTQKAPTNLNRMGQLPKSNFVNVSAAPMRVLNIGQSVRHSGTSNLADQAFKTVPAPVIIGSGPQYPSFQAMPASISRNPIGASIRVDDSSRPIASVSIVSPQAYKNTVQVPLAPTMMSRFPSAGSFSQNTLALRKEHVPASAYPAQYQPTNYAQLQNHYSYNQQQNQAPKLTSKIDNMVSYNTITNQNSAPDYSSQAVYEKILAISKATNLSVEAIEAAVKLRQQQLMNQMIISPPSTTTTTTTTTPRPLPPPPPTPKRYTKYQDPAQKVMNAPKEYYPVGYDKNFDDNFVSKVELPETSFYCGDQKHFPGLYGDEDLGCMVFHVCALTDEGLIMKSFLCPESTLFDQTILKCNWWFYVDCKSSKRLYDSNIPVSKSYQLMKALTFFSSYKKEVQGEDGNNNLARSAITENKEGVRNAVKILQTQSHMELPKVEIVERKSSPTTVPSTSRSSKGFTPVNAVEINSLSTDVKEEDNITGEKVEQRDSNRKYRKQASIRPKEDTQNSLSETSTSRNANIQKIAPQQTTSSTEKNTIKLTSVRKPLRKRPNNNLTKSKEIVSNTTIAAETSETVKQRHRSERASEERKDEDVHKKAKTSQVKINIQEVAGNANSHVIKPARKESVDVTIAKMDEAIIGQKKRDFT